jgi:hypothetical protein
VVARPRPERARVREDYEAVRAKSTGGDVLEPVLAPAESIVLTLEP